MKNYRLLFAWLLVPLLTFAADPASPAPAGSHSATPAEIRKNADALEKAGKFKEALELNRQLALDPALAGPIVVQGLKQGVACLQRLNLIADTDTFIEAVTAAHPRDWRVLQTAASCYDTIPHSGYIVGGQFSRGWHRGSGRWVNTGERDRLRALQLLEQARPLGPGPDDKRDFSSVLLDYANTLQDNRLSPSQSWRLQAKTDLTALPDWDDAAPSSSATSGAPVDETGEPILYAVPRAFDSAQNDGERIRWLQNEAANGDPSRLLNVLLSRADFLNRQFGVETLADQPLLFRPTDDDAENAKSLYALDTLGEHEALARLATGITRFALPVDHNPILLLRQIVVNAASPKSPNEYAGNEALTRLAAIFENRRQYPKAVACWQENITRYGTGRNH